MGAKPYHDEETLRELYWEEGMTIVEIAEKFDVTHGTVWQQMEKNGVDRRSPGEHRKYDKQELLDWIDVFVKQFGVVPSRGDFAVESPTPAPLTYKRHFGSFTEAVREAGYTPRGDKG